MKILVRVLPDLSSQREKRLRKADAFFDMG